MTERKTMDDSTLTSILSAKITNSLGFFGGRIAKQRVQAMQYYHGEAFGNEQEGRSQVVSRDVAEVVDGMMPSLMRIFTAGDTIVKFEPQSQEDVNNAEQATDYCNWIWYTQNPGFKIIHDWFKDALLQKLGVIKIWWEEQEDVTEERYEGVTDVELQILKTDPEVEIVEQVDYPSASPLASDLMAQMLQQGGVTATVHDVVLKRRQTCGRVRIMPIPPEEFLIERRATDLEETPFVAHRVRKTASDLIEMGYSQKLIEGIDGSGEGEYNMERLERFRQEDELPYRTDGVMDNSMRLIWVTECYVKVDYDGDGVAEWRKVTVGGETGYTILDNEPVSDHPFAALTPVPMPHKLYGESMADKSMDLQLIKSTLWRQGLDNLYQSNNSRVVVDPTRVNLDDLLTVRPGGIIRSTGGVDAVQPLSVPDMTAGALQMIEYTDSVKEKRTGQTAYNQGLDADSLNKTATGISKIMQAGNDRLELVARVFAETGFKRAFRRILHLLTEYQNKPTVIRLRNQWIPMDPREWKNSYDLTVQVGLGTGDRQATFGQMSALLQIDRELISMQGGLNGPFVTAKNLYNKLAKMVEASGHRDVASYYSDPDQMPPQPPKQLPPDPRMLAVQAKAQADQAQLQQQGELDQQRMAMEMQLEREKQQMQATQIAQQNQLEAQRDQLDRQADAILQRQQQMFDAWREQMQAAVKIAVADIGARTQLAAAETTALVSHADQVASQDLNNGS